MQESAKFWSKKKKAAFEKHHAADLASHFHGKTISPFVETTIKWPKAGQDDALNRNPKFQIAEPIATRRALATLALLIAASMSGVVTPSSAQTAPIPPPAVPAPVQTVPIPKPAPKGRDLQMTASDSQRRPMTTGATPAAGPPDPVVPDPRRNIPANIFSSFDASQKAQAARVSSYLSSLQTLVGNFVQVGPDGSKTKGDFYIQKPGKGRFEYHDPSPIAIIPHRSSLFGTAPNL